MQAAGAASSLQFRRFFKCWKSIFNCNSAVSPEDIKAGEVLVSIPLPALVTRYFVSLKLTELESFQCVLYPGQPFFKPIHILLDRTCPHRFIDLKKTSCTPFAGPLLSLASAFSSSPIPLLPAHRLHLHVLPPSLTSGTPASPPQAVLAKANCFGR